MNKMLVFDLDGTVLNDNHQVAEKNIKAMKIANNYGYRTVPCTGRGPTFLSEVINELQLNKKDEYLIACNGALVVEIKTNKILMCNEIDFDDVQTLFNYGIHKGFDVQIYTTHNTYAFNKEQYVSDRMKIYGKKIKFINSNDIRFLKKEHIIKIIYERAQKLKNISVVREDVARILNNRIEMIISNRGIIEISKSKTTKASGLIFLADYLKINLADTIAVGDDENDVKMIEVAGLGVAVKNARDSVKKVADVVSNTTNNEGVLEEIVNRYIVHNN